MCYSIPAWETRQNKGQHAKISVGYNNKLNETKANETQTISKDHRVTQN